MLDLDSTLFGKLVRPRVLVYTFDEDKYLSFKEAKPFLVPLRPKQVEHLLAVHNKPLNQIFCDLNIGDTTKNTLTAYCCQVTSIVVYTYRNNGYKVYRNKEQFDALESKLANSKLPSKPSIVAIGVKLYGGFNENGPVKPWHHEYEFFYEPRELLPLNHIILYENCQPKDYVVMPNGCGLVLHNNTLNKYKWYKTGSWTCHKIMVLSGSDERIFKLMPYRKFMIRRQGVDHLLGEPFVDSNGVLRNFHSLLPPK